MKRVETLVEDIYELVYKGFTPSDENLAIFTKNITETLSTAFQQGCARDEAPRLRMSNIGTPNRKLYYMFNNPIIAPISPAQAIAFSYGHIIEQMLLLLAREAGHVVTEEQREVELDGIIGHIDCRIDGMLVDVKGMSNYNFQKFLSTSALLANDTYGYVPQISGYAQAMKDESASFFAYNKERGTLVLCLLEDFDLINARARIKEVREMLVSKTPPAKRCYRPVNQTKTSPNLVLDKNCEWCGWKYECWAEANGGQGLRAFRYASGVQHFVDVVSEPRVEEVFREKLRVEIEAPESE